MVNSLDNAKKPLLSEQDFNSAGALWNFLKEENKQALDEVIRTVQGSWLSILPLVRRWLLRKGIQKLLPPPYRHYPIPDRVLDRLLVNFYHLKFEQIQSQVDAYKQVSPANEKAIATWVLEISRALQASFSFQKYSILRNAVQKNLFPNDFFHYF